MGTKVLTIPSLVICEYLGQIIIFNIYTRTCDNWYLKNDKDIKECIAGLC